MLEILARFSLIELVLFAVVWAVVGGLPGFYLFSAIDRNPRNGARIGVVAGVLVGFGALVLGLAEDIQSLFLVAAIFWAVTLVLALGLSVTRTGMGTHSQRASISQITADMAYGLLLPTFVIVFTIVVFPMIWNVVLAFRPVRLADLPTLQVFSLQDLSLSNFERIFRNSERFFDDFWPFAIYTVIYAVLLVVGWFGGRYVARSSNRDENQGAWIGLVVALVVVVLMAARQQYLMSIGDVLSGRHFLNTLTRTIVYTLTGTILAISMGLIAALVVKDKFPGRNIVRGFMLFPYIAPIVSVVFIWKLLLNAQFGLVNEFIDLAGGQRTDFLTTPGTAFLMIVLFQGWRYFPFAFLFILARIQAIPDDIYEAAQVDGAAPSQRLLYITLPQLQAVFGTLFLLRFIWTFNKFDDVFLLTGGAANTQLVTIEIYDQLFGRSNVGAASAVALVLAFVLFIVVGIYFRWFYTEEN